MGRPPKYPKPPGDETPGGGAPASKPVRTMPDRMVNGVANVEYFRKRLEEFSALAIAAEERGQPFANYGAHVRAFELECKLAGIDPDTVMDQRSEMQVFEDALKLLIENDTAALFEMGDKELAALEDGFDAVDSGSMSRIEELIQRAAAEGRKPFSDQQVAVARRLGKEIRSRVKRVRALRIRARSPIPPETDKRMRDAVEAAHPLRFMLYVGRTNEITMGADGTNVFRIADHHCSMAVALWEAKNGVHFHGRGLQRGVVKYKGCILVTPPRHGKSEFGLHATALEICLRPDDLQGIIVHAEASMASGYLQYVAKFFRDFDDAKCRRRDALYPGVGPSGRDNNQKAMRLAAGESLRDPTLRSNGVHDKRSGANCNWLYLDDPVDQEERKSEAARDATAQRVQNTWMTRMTGERAFLLYCTTLWHENDSTCRIIKLAKEGKAQFKVLILPAGGPKDNFKPLWPDSPYRESWLRAKYAEDPVFYSLVYMCDPSSEEARMVRKLALFSPTLPGGAIDQSHADFLSDCTSYLSIDPAATTKKESDRCGVVYGAKGFLRSKWTDDAGNEHTRIIRRLRILGAIREKCAPNQIIEAVRTFAQNNPVNTVIMETIGGFSVLADWARTAAGIDVTEFKPGATKLVRLKECQVMLDDSKRAEGVVPVVEFPGVWEDRDAIACPSHPAADRHFDDGLARCGECRKVFNRLVPDPSVEWLVEEIIRFGQISSDDGLDAVTQLCIFLRDELGVGETHGRTSIRGFIRRGDNVRMAREMEVFRRSLEPRDCDQDDYRYHVASYN